MKRLLLLLACAALLIPGAASAFQVTGRFLYEDRMWNGSGYTGAVQNLPIRHARVEIVNLLTQQVLASGATDANGAYALDVTGQILPVSFYARCVTDGRPTYQIWVVNAPQRDLMGGWVPPNAPLHAITTDSVLAHPPAQNHAFGDYLIQDTDGTGVAQAFNIFDCAVDYFDWLSQPGLLGRLPNASEYVTYSWGSLNVNEGSNYTAHTILLSSPTQGADTDGWSDTVIMHETGHWFDDVFSQTDNPGGAHFIGDNNANVLLAYGEGAATYHCAKVREWRALTHGTDQLVSLYADLQIPPDVGTPGGLSFSYDFETGNFGDSGAPIGQRGSANETNVTSALWDLMDGPGTPDATPGVDDDPVESTDAIAWNIEHNYLNPLPASAAITVEDYYQGWFALNGPGYLQTGLDAIFVTLAKMPFYLDPHEPDNGIANAGTITPVAHTLAAGRVVINEIDMGPLDAIELYNGTPDPIDLTGWRLEVFANGLAPEESLNVYVFPAFTLQGGAVVAVHEGGTQLVDDGQVHLYAGDQQVFNASWNNGLDGACILRNAGNQVVDFVRWRAADGTPNHTMPPAGAIFTGDLDTPPAPQTLARDIHGTDTDAAADFSGHFGSVGSANHPSPQSHTVYGIGDQDVVAFTATANTAYGFEARSFYSASDARLELLDGNGTVIGSNDNVDPSVRDARVEFLAPAAGTYYLRVTHVGMDTDWAEYDLLAFQRPPTNALLAPAGLTAAADNTANSQDGVALQWANSSAYDSVHVYRDGALLTSLAGDAVDYQDHADRGLYQYEIAGVRAGTETGHVGDYTFAGLLSCFAGDDFESGNANQWAREESQPASRWDVTPLAQSGTFGFTDSPAGLYRGCPSGAAGCKVNAIAEFGLPAILTAGAKLEWDQICITEAGFDYCIVEISSDDGASWSELARYDMNSDPRWADMAAAPGDWRHESIDLSSHQGQEAVIRFRLESDSNLEFDGWYVDNVLLNDPSCVSAVAVGDPTTPKALAFLPPAPNPVRSSARFAWTLPRDESRVDLALYDVSGRVVRYERLGAQTPGLHSWVWDGRDGQGRTVGSGAYYARLTAGNQTLQRKVLKLAQ